MLQRMYTNICLWLSLPCSILNYKVVGNAAPAVVGSLSAGPDGLPLRDAFLGVVGGSYVLSSALFAAVAAYLDAADSTDSG